MIDNPITRASVCQSDCAKMAEWIDVMFVVETPSWAPRNSMYGGFHHQRRGGVVRPVFNFWSATHFSNLCFNMLLFVVASILEFISTMCCTLFCCFCISCCCGCLLYCSVLRSSITCLKELFVALIFRLTSLQSL